MQYLVAYDISHETTQHQIREYVRQYSISGQKSAYECELNSSTKTQLKHFIRHKLSNDDAFCMIKIQKSYWHNITHKHLHIGTDDYIYVG